MAGRYGADDCFYSLFSSQKRSPSPYTARKTSQEEERTWGNLPIAAGQGRFFPRPAPGSPERDTGRRGHGALKDMADREKRARRLECGHRWGRSPEMQAAGLRRTQACAASCCPRKTRTACRQRTGRAVCAVPGRGQQGRAGERPSGLGAQKAGGNCLVLGHCTAHLRRLCRTQDVRKPPQGRGFPVRRRAAAGYDGCRCVMEQAEGGGISCFGVYPSEAGSFLRERR